MKTPRQILLERHRSATPKLDAIRRKVIAGLTEIRVLPSPQTKASPGISWSIWGFLTGFRWHGAGLAAAWMLIALLNGFAAHDQGQSPPPSDAPWPRQLRSDLLEHRRQIVELLQAPLDTSAPAPGAPARVPGRRGTRGSTNAMA